MKGSFSFCWRSPFVFVKESDREIQKIVIKEMLKSRGYGEQFISVSDCPIRF